MAGKSASTSPEGGSPRSGKSPQSQPQGGTIPAALVATGTIPPTSHAPLEADDQESDRDSLFGSDVASVSTSGTSVTESIYKFRVQNGRTYHSYRADEANYNFPNDESELERLDLQHSIMIMMQGNELYKCPAGKDGKPLRRVLDVGTGTGIWALEVAEEHPETSVVGIDLSPVQPKFVPPNVEFFIDDLDQEWTFHTPFDFIYMRVMSGSVKDWPKWLAQAYKHLRPGGYIELCDPINPVRCDDGTLTEDSHLLKWNRLWLEAGAKIGFPLDSALHYKRQLAEAGFTNIVQHEYKWPTNDWPKNHDAKQLGMWVHANMSPGLDGLSMMLFTKVLGWSEQEVQVLVALARKDMADRRIHAYWPAYTVYAQKPE